MQASSQLNPERDKIFCDTALEREIIPRCNLAQEFRFDAQGGVLARIFLKNCGAKIVHVFIFLFARAKYDRNPAQGFIFGAI